VNYWLIKSEPEAFSIDDLKNAPGKREHWDGIRNYQARNYLRDDMQKGDQVFFIIPVALNRALSASVKSYRRPIPITRPSTLKASTSMREARLKIRGG